MFLFVMLLAVAEVGCVKHAVPLPSPDGWHVAVLSFSLSGVFDSDFATVSVRHWWSPFARRVYRGPGQWDFKNREPRSPIVRWLDNKHLSIDLAPGFTHGCLEEWVQPGGDVEVQCVGGENR